MKIKKKLLAVLAVACLLFPCIVEAVDMVEYWNYTNLHTRYFRELSINPPSPSYGINWSQAQGYTETRDGIDWYKYVWDFIPNIRARTAMGHNLSYQLDGFDKYFVANRDQMFNPYRILSGRFVSLFNEWGSYETMYKWVTTSWTDWTRGSVLGSSSNLSGINDIWSDSITYHFKDGSSKTWTGDFIELIWSETWPGGSADMVCHLLKGTGLVAIYWYDYGAAWSLFQQGKQQGIPACFPPACSPAGLTAAYAAYQ